jgi:hypothetical protein
MIEAHPDMSAIKKYAWLLMAMVTIILPGRLQSQQIQLVKDGAVWRESASWLISVSPDSFGHARFQYVIQQDTLINGHMYKKIFSSTYGPSPWVNMGYIGALREDSMHRVFFLPDTLFNMHLSIPVGPSIDIREHLLYDFSLSVGDTFLVQNPSDSMHFLNNSDSVLISGTWRKRMTFTTGSGIFPRTWIEGIGDINGLFYPFIWPFESMHRLNCFEDSSIFWLHPAITAQGGDCFTVGLKEDASPQPPFGLSIISDPTSAFLRIQISPEPERISCRIYSIKGQLIFTQTYLKPSSLDIDVSSLQNGLYFLKVDTESGSISKLFPIVH